MNEPPIKAVHTAELTAGDHDQVRDLLDVVFGDDFDEHDWEHILGGMHVLCRVDGNLIGHGAVIQRQLIYDGRAMRVGYIEGLAVHAAYRRHGHASTIMGYLEEIISNAYQFGALSGTESSIPLYAGRGWQPWKGPTSVLTPSGLDRTPEDDEGVMVLPGAAVLDTTLSLACDWRAGDVW